MQRAGFDEEFVLYKRLSPRLPFSQDLGPRTPKVPNAHMSFGAVVLRQEHAHTAFL